MAPSILDTLVGRAPTPPPSPANGSSGPAVLSIGPDTQTAAMKVTAVYAAITLIAGSVGTMKLEVLRRDKKKREPVEDNRYRHIWDRPNPNMTKVEFWEMAAAHLLMYGNAFIWKARATTPNQPVQELWLIHPKRMQVGLGKDRKKVFVLDRNEDRPYTSREIMHVMALGTDGVVGLSPLDLARRTIAIGSHAETYAERFFAQGTHLAGTLNSPNVIPPEGAQELLDNWNKLNTGTMRAGKTAVLDAGLEFHALATDPEKSQHLEVRLFTVRDIARIFVIPPHLLADVTGSTSWGAGIEAQNIGFHRYTLLRWTSRLEAAISDELLDGMHSAKFNEMTFMRADVKTRGEWYAKLRQWGVLSANDIRALENLDPLAEGGDIYFAPTNMTDLAQFPPEPSQNAQDGPESPDPGSDDPGTGDDEVTDSWGLRREYLVISEPTCNRCGRRSGANIALVEGEQLPELWCQRCKAPFEVSA